MPISIIRFLNALADVWSLNRTLIFTALLSLVFSFLLNVEAGFEQRQGEKINDFVNKYRYGSLP